MHVLAGVNLPTDQPHWIRREHFFQYFDQNDFLDRHVLEVQPAYLEKWFYDEPDGGLRFMIPVSGAIGRRTDLISSRHRLAVLLPHLEELPIAFATAHLSADARGYLESIPRRPLNPSEQFWIPDLPIHMVLPWPPK